MSSDRRVQPSFFELTVAMAFDYFARMEADVAVIEVGMGGRLDSTNIITPELSVITNIGHDHMEFLGDTLAEVAGEKAGIIKEGVPVVIGETHSETRDVFISRAEKMNAPMSFADREYRCNLGDIDNVTGLRQYMLYDLHSHAGRRVSPRWADWHSRKTFRLLLQLSRNWPRGSDLMRLILRGVWQMWSETPD